MVVRVRRFTILRLALVVAFAATALTFSGGAGAGTAVLPTLYVNYTMNCTFSITDDSGKPVTAIAPGTYQVQITTPMVFADVDLSGTFDMTACKSFVQFQLTGPGVNISTTLQEGDEDYGIFTATFQNGGSYTAQDNNQPSVARAVFAVSASSAPLNPTAPYTTSGSTKGATQGSLVGSNAKAKSAAVLARGTLIATVNAAGTPSLTYNGMTVTSLKSGRYTISVVDRSRKSGFIIQETHKAATTAASTAFVGKRSLKLDLKIGQWLFYPSIIGRKSYFFVTG